MRYLIAVVVLVAGCVPGVGVRYGEDDRWPELRIEARDYVRPVAFTVNVFGREALRPVAFDVVKDVGTGVLAQVRLATADVMVRETGIQVGATTTRAIGQRGQVGWGVRCGLVRLTARPFTASTVTDLAPADITSPSLELDDLVMHVSVEAVARVRIGSRTWLGGFVELCDNQTTGTLRYYHTDPAFDAWVADSETTRASRVRWGVALVATF